MRVTLRQLNVFVEVARRASFSVAAGQLHLSQPAVSRQIRELETALGLRLIDRSTRTVQLTAGGQRLLERAEHLLQVFRSTVAEVRQDPVEARPIVRVLLQSADLERLLAPGLAWCQQRYPTIAVILHRPGDERGMREGGDGLDFGVGNVPPQGGGWRHQVVGHRRLHLIAPARAPWSDGAPFRWQQLQGQSLVVLAAGPVTRSVLQQSLQGFGVDAAGICEAVSLASACRQVLAGKALGVWPGWLQPTSGGPLLSSPLLPVVEHEFVLWRRDNRPLAAAAQLIWTALTRFLAESWCDSNEYG